MSGKPTNFVPMMPPLSVTAPAHLNSDIPRAVMNAAIRDPNRTTIEPTSRDIASQLYHGVRLINEKGRAVVFAAKVAWRTNALLERIDTPAVSQGDRVAEGGGPPPCECNVLVQLACVSDETWERLDDEMLAAPTFYALIPTVVQDMQDLKKSFPPLYANMLGDPRVLDLLGMAAEGDKRASRISRFLKDPSVDTFSKSVREALQAGAALFLTGQRALPTLPRKVVHAASEMLRKKPGEDALKISMTDLGEPQPLQEAILCVDESLERPIRLERLRDTIVSFQDRDYSRNSSDQMFVVRTRNFMQHLVNWKRAFMIWSPNGAKSGQDSKIILMSNVEETKGKRSPHNTIRRGLRLMLARRYELHELMAREVERGYIRPGDDGTFEVFSLSGGNIFVDGHVLSHRAVRVKEAFEVALGVDVVFVEDDETHRKFDFK